MSLYYANPLFNQFFVPEVSFLPLIPAAFRLEKHGIGAFSGGMRTWTMSFLLLLSAALRLEKSEIAVFFKEMRPGFVEFFLRLI